MHWYVIQHMLNKFQFIIDFQVRPCYTKSNASRNFYIMRAVAKCTYIDFFFSPVHIDRNIKFPNNFYTYLPVDFTYSLFCDNKLQ